MPPRLRAGTRPWGPALRVNCRRGRARSGVQQESNYALRRLVVALAAIALLTGVTWGVGTLAFSATPVSSGTQYVVQPGDTLWSIAQDHAPNSDPRRTVEAIRTLNRIGPEIRPGQQIFLPD